MNDFTSKRSSNFGHLDQNFWARSAWKVARPGALTLLTSGKLSHNYWKSPFLMGKSTISMAIFNSYVKLPEGNFINLFIYHANRKVSPSCKLVFTLDYRLIGGFNQPPWKIWVRLDHHPNYCGKSSNCLKPLSGRSIPYNPVKTCRQFCASTCRDSRGPHRLLNGSAGKTRGTQSEENAICNWYSLCFWVDFSR